MFDDSEVDYAVVLVLSGFGSEREFAETVLECALDWLNTNKEEPGMRFAPPVSAHLEIVQDADEARERITSDPQVAMVLVHGLDEAERDQLFRECAAEHVSRCTTVETTDAEREAARAKRRQQREWRVVFRERDPDEISAHQLSDDTLVGPLARR